MLKLWHGRPAVCELQSNPVQPGCKNLTDQSLNVPMKLQVINKTSFVHYNFQYLDWKTC